MNISTLKGPQGEDKFEAYTENNTPVAYRIVWYYGSDKKQITILAITSSSLMYIKTNITE